MPHSRPTAPAAARPGPATGVGQAEPFPQWWAAARAHAARADALTAGARGRTARGENHAIEDFLYAYYAVRPARLRRWHPGVGVVLAPPRPDEVPDAAHGAYAERAAWRWYRVTEAGVVLDAPAFRADRADTIRYVRDLLARTAGRQAQFGCFGLHEWAMVYRDRETGRDHRHRLPLRLGAAGTDEVVERHTIRCTHVDAFRFFTPEAVGLNTVRPTRAAQPAMEQSGCLHAGMDCYKWAAKLGPAVPGGLVLEAFALAHEIRVVDMRASPYDVTSYGQEPIAIETPEGKAEYVRHQRDFAERSAGLRAALVAVCDAVLAEDPTAEA